VIEVQEESKQYLRMGIFQNLERRRRALGLIITMRLMFDGMRWLYKVFEASKSTGASGKVSCGCQHLINSPFIDVFIQLSLPIPNKEEVTNGESILIAYNTIL